MYIYEYVKDLNFMMLIIKKINYKKIIRITGYYCAGITIINKRVHIFYRNLY